MVHLTRPDTMCSHLYSQSYVSITEGGGGGGGWGGPYFIALPIERLKSPRSHVTGVPSRRGCGLVHEAAFDSGGSHLNGAPSTVRGSRSRREKAVIVHGDGNSDDEGVGASVDADTSVVGASIG